MHSRTTRALAAARCTPTRASHLGLRTGLSCAARAPRSRAPPLASLIANLLRRRSACPTALLLLLPTNGRPNPTRCPMFRPARVRPNVPVVSWLQFPLPLRPGAAASAAAGTLSRETIFTLFSGRLSCPWPFPPPRQWPPASHLARLPLSLVLREGPRQVTCFRLPCNRHRPLPSHAVPALVVALNRRPVATIPRGMYSRRRGLLAEGGASYL